MPRYREADVQGSVDIGKAAGQFPAFGRRVRQLALEVGKFLDLREWAGRRLLPQLPGEKVTASPQVIAFGPIAVGMDHEMLADFRVCGQVGGPLLRSRAIGKQAGNIEPLIRCAAGNSAVDYIDDAADGGRAVDQGRWSPQDLDAF